MAGTWAATPSRAEAQRKGRGGPPRRPDSVRYLASTPVRPASTTRPAPTNGPSGLIGKNGSGGRVSPCSWTNAGTGRGGERRDLFRRDPARLGRAPRTFLGPRQSMGTVDTTACRAAFEARQGLKGQGNSGAAITSTPRLEDRALPCHHPEDTAYNVLSPKAGGSEGSEVEGARGTTLPQHSKAPRLSAGIHLLISGLVLRRAMT